MTAVMIGIDPHKGSPHRGGDRRAEMVLGELRIRASATQVGKLVEWAADWPERTWAAAGRRRAGSRASPAARRGRGGALFSLNR